MAKRREFRKTVVNRDVTFRAVPCLVLLTALLVSGLVAAPVHAQATAEQIEMVNKLPPAQRRALLEQLAGQGSSVREEAVEFPELMLDRSLGSMRSDQESEATPETPRLLPGSTIAVQFSIPKVMANTPAETVLRDEMSQRVTRLLGRNVFEVDADGILSIANYYAIPVAGLSASEAAIRIASESDFRDLDVTLTILPLTPTGSDALESFGADLFSGVPTTFAPATDIPVPSDYVMGPGDNVIVQLFGSDNATHNLVVNRDGTLNLPGIGPVSVVGMRFDDLKTELGRRIEEQMLGARASITLGELRSIRVFVLGDVNQPGAYTVSGLSTMTNALLVSGGIRANGSMRGIRLKRDGVIVGRLDLYDLLLRGDTRGDARLQPGDVIFVPPVGNVIGVAGEVKRPARYELRGEKTVAELITLAGGLSPTAYAPGTQLERISASGRREVLEVDLAGHGAKMTVRAGDVIRVVGALDDKLNTVEVVGRAWRTGSFQWHEGMRLTDLLASLDALKVDADPRYLLIERERHAGADIEVFSANLVSALAGRAGAADPRLAARDRVHVLGREIDRSERLVPLVDRLRDQARRDRPAQIVSVSGRVIAEGDYPLQPGMRISDLIRASAGLQEAAYTLDAELTRQQVVGGGRRSTELVPVDLQAILAGDSAADMVLEPHDILTIKEIPEWDLASQIQILGEVQFPGTYTVHRGESLASVLRRAGGLTDLAFPAGSVFVREDLRRREQEQLELLASRLESDLVTFSLQSLQGEADAAQVLQLGQSLLTQLRATKAAGRLVIDIERVITNHDGATDIIVKNGDQLFIPKRTQEVTVLGEVQYATSHIHQDGLTREDYIQRSGGLTQKADSKRIYVVRANGSVIASEASAWFRRSTATDIRAGDTIVVPLDADRMSRLTLWSSVSQIVYQLALAAASAKSIGVL